MKIIIDTREKIDAIQPLLQDFELKGIETKRQKLDVGDYMNADNLTKDGYYIIIDRKGNGLNELALNLGSHFVQFKNEILRARQNKILLVVLIVDETRTCLEDIKSWSPQYNTRGKKKAMTGEKMYKTISTLSNAYRDCLHFEFVKKDKLAERIIELLN